MESIPAIFSTNVQTIANKASKFKSCLYLDNSLLTRNISNVNTNIRTIRSNQKRNIDFSKFIQLNDKTQYYDRDTMRYVVLNEIEQQELYDYIRLGMNTHPFVNDLDVFEGYDYANEEGLEDIDYGITTCDKEMKEIQFLEDELEYLDGNSNIINISEYNMVVELLTHRESRKILLNKRKEETKKSISEAIRSGSFYFNKELNQRSQYGDFLVAKMKYIARQDKINDERIDNLNILS